MLFSKRSCFASSFYIGTVCISESEEDMLRVI